MVFIIFIVKSLNDIQRKNMDLKKDISILYFGTPEISAFVLNKLIENNYKIVGVVAQEDKPIGRKGLLEHVPTKKVALKYGIPVYQFKKVREHYEEILNIKPDLILTLAFGQIISHDILTIPKYGCLNLHGSILPKYRGAAPIQYSLLNGDAETGISLMEMVDKCDAGKVYAVEKVKIELDDNCTSLTDKLKVAAFDVFDKIAAGLHLHALRCRIQGVPGQSGRIGNGDGFRTAHRRQQFLMKQAYIRLINRLVHEMFPPFPEAVYTLPAPKARG